MKIAKDFFSEETEVTEENCEAKATEKKGEADEVPGEAVQKELFHFVHPALDEGEGWKVHREVENLVKRFELYDICKRLNQLKKEGKILLPESPKKALNELQRMGLPTDKRGFDYKTFCKKYNAK